MGVFKEEAHAFETIAKKSQKIYNDAADYGYPYNIQDPPEEIICVIDIITDLKVLDAEYPEEKNLVRNRQIWGEGNTKGVSVDVIIFWERNGRYDIGTKYSISFNKISKHPSLINKEFDGFISVNVDPYSEKS